LKCALITGGSRGIGKAIAFQLAIEHGYHVLINYISNLDAANACLHSIVEHGGSAELLQFAVQNQNEVNNKLELWFNSNPEAEIEVLVNNAGIAKDSLFAWMNKENWDDVLSVSLGGFYNVTKAILPNMLKYKYGRIINISSISGVKGNAGQVNYSAAKAGIIGATKALAQEVGRMNITVNAVAPGFIKTEMLDDVDTKVFRKLIPLGRAGLPTEVANLVCFLASEKASYITGEVININGGIYS
jgi:3-oxoacyl-[acyl-carrier protein] reductase